MDVKHENGLWKIRWLRDRKPVGLPHLEPDLRVAVEGELASRARAARRFYESCSALANDEVTFRTPLQDAELLLEVVNAGYRVLSRRIHPDTGGSNEQQQRLNALVGDLRCALQEGVDMARLEEVADDP